MQDLKIFIDWSVAVTDTGRAVARNLIDGESRTFRDLTEAVDYAAARTNTLSPVFPAGYRSKTVRMLELMEVYGIRDLYKRSMEEIVIDDTPPGHSETHEDPPDVVLRREARKMYLTALEATSEDEERGWISRGRDFEAQAEALERKRAELTSREEHEPHPDAFRHVSGRSHRAVAGFGNKKY